MDAGDKKEEKDSARDCVEVQRLRAVRMSDSEVDISCSRKVEYEKRNEIPGPEYLAQPVKDSNSSCYMY